MHYVQSADTPILLTAAGFHPPVYIAVSLIGFDFNLLDLDLVQVVQHLIVHHPICLLVILLL